MKTEKKNLCNFIFCLNNRIAILRSCCCVALELDSRFLQIWVFFWMFLKGIVHQLLKCGLLKRNQVAIWKSRAYNCFLFVEPGSKNRKTVCWRCFLCKLIWFNQSSFCYWGFLFVCKALQCSNPVWAISSSSLRFIVWLSSWISKTILNGFFTSKQNQFNTKLRT